MGERLRAYRAAAERGSPLTNTGLAVFEKFAELYPLAYEDGALPAKTLEFVALAISVVRDCEDCITYHMIRLHELGASREEVIQVFGLTLVVGGSTVIPTVRRSALSSRSWRRTSTRRAEGTRRYPLTSPSVERGPSVSR